jgi:hypothetical protein
MTGLLCSGVNGMGDGVSDEQPSDVMRSETPPGSTSGTSSGTASGSTSGDARPDLARTPAPQPAAGGAPIGLALGTDRIVAVVRTTGGSGGLREVRIPLDPPLSDASDPAPALHQGLARLEAELGLDPEGARGGLRIALALLPPLAETRRLSLPPLRKDEAERVVRRDVARHFVGRGRGTLVAVHPPGLAAATSEGWLEGVIGVFRARGWAVDRVVPAHTGWIAAGVEAEVRLVLATDGAAVHLIHLRDGEVLGLRRLPLADPEGIIEAALPEPGKALILADAENRGFLSRRLSSAGWRLLDGVQGAPTPGGVAAARTDGLLVFDPPSMQAARTARRARQALRMGVAAAVLLLFSGVVHVWGLTRDVQRLQADRASIRTSVAPALVLRDSIDRMEARLASLQLLDAASSRWTFSLVEIAAILPPEIHLTGFRAAGDTVVLEGTGPRAGDALLALRSASTLTDVRLEGAIRRELEAGNLAEERFTLSALLRQGGRP